MVIPGQKGHGMSSCASAEIAGTLLRCLNAVPTAEGAIQIAMEELYGLYEEILSYCWFYAGSISSPMHIELLCPI